ncbi:MAG: hypothetical protein OHK0036_20520 [Bacteroidia bacterium]
MNTNPTQSLKEKGSLISEFQSDNIQKDFYPIAGKPFNIDKITLEQIDNLKINYIFTTGRSASTLLGVMLMMSEEVIFCLEEIFPIILKQKYSKIKQWTEQIIKEYCDDFVLMSEGKLYPLFCGKDVLYELLIRFKEHLNYERAIRISYLSFGINKDLSKITTIVDKQLRYYLSHHYLELFPSAKILLLVRDPRDNVYSKYNRAIRKKIKTDVCLYIHTWKIAFEKYISIINQYKNQHIVIQFEELINNPNETLTNICQFIGIHYTNDFFKFYEVTQKFFNNISHPTLKEHFDITHKSLTRPLTPQKVNEWKNKFHQSDIAGIINSCWTICKNIAKLFNYTDHDGYTSQSIQCLKTILRIKWNEIMPHIFFNIIPYSIKRKIKQKKYPYRINSPSAYDKFLRKGYL